MTFGVLQKVFIGLMAIKREWTTNGKEVVKSHGLNTTFLIKVLSFFFF